MPSLSSFFKKTVSFVKKIDIFAFKTQLKMNRRTRFSTVIGGVFTLLLIGLSTLLFIHFGYDMINHTNPISVSSEIYVEDPILTQFSSENNFIMFGVQYPNYTHFVDETIYKITLTQSYIGSNSSKSFSKSVPIGRCTPDDLPQASNMNKYFTDAWGSPINEVLCVKNLSNYWIQGSFDTNDYAYMQIKVSSCANNTADPTAPICKPKEIINKYLNSGYFAICAMDYIIDPTNFSNPAQVVGKDYVSPLSLGIMKTVRRNIQTMRFISDDGFLLSSPNEGTYPTLNSDLESLVLDNNNQGTLIKFTMRMHHNEKIVRRTYMKVQQVLAVTGGFIQMLYLILFILSYPVISKLYFEKIINTVYNFEMEPNEIRKSSTSTKIYMAMQSHITNDSNKAQPKVDKVAWKTNPGSVKKDKYIKDLVKIQNKPPLKTTLWEYIKGTYHLFSTNNREKSTKFNRLHIGKKAIKEKLDVSYILKKFYEFDKLKMLLLNENQYYLFESLSKPVILKNLTIDLGYAKNSNFISYETDFRAKIRKLNEAYANIKGQHELDFIDKRLLDLMDENIKQIFEVTIFFFF